jgi:hypothetical protein
MDSHREASKNGTEIWKPIIGCGDRYEISNLGMVRSKRCILSQVRDPRGYSRVNISDTVNGHQKSRLVHALVLMAFDGPKQAGQVCRHLDGNPKNNALHNLCWGTHRDNHLDAVKHGTHFKPPKLIQRGEKNHAVKLTREQVDHIRQRTATAKELASLYGITQWTVFDIRKGRSWAHL